jgi:hypothetical protein
MTDRFSEGAFSEAGGDKAKGWLMVRLWRLSLEMIALG